MIATRPIQQAGIAPPRPRIGVLTGCVLAAVLLALAVRTFVVFENEINWDEFHYLALIYRYQVGSLQSVFQTLHVHLFDWLPLVSSNEADQVVAGRLVMLACQAGTGVLLYHIGRRFLRRDAALFAVLSYFSFTYVIWQGTSFRADPLATLLLMGAIDVIIQKREPLIHAAVAGLLIALAGMVTIKSALYLPTIAILLLMPMAGTYNCSPLKPALIAVVSVVAGFVVLYLLHQASLAPASMGTTEDILSHSWEKTISMRTLFPAGNYLVHTLSSNALYWLFVLTGLFVALRSLLGAEVPVRARAVVLLALALPLASLAFYRNGFPYYYVFMLAPVSILCGAGWEALWATSCQRLSKALSGIAICVCVFNLVGHGIYRPYIHSLSAQRAVLAVVHRMFPAPIPYIDRGGMVASFPEAGFWMSTWGLDSYRARGIPVFERRIARWQPKFLLADIAELDVAHMVFHGHASERYRLLEADSDALRDNYVPYWGPIYIAGKRFVLAAEGQVREFDIAIAGPYTIAAACDAAVTIDGKPYRSGAVVVLARGRHSIAARTAPAAVTLTWGRNLYWPDVPAPESPLFTGF